MSDIRFINANPFVGAYNAQIAAQGAESRAEDVAARSRAEWMRAENDRQEIAKSLERQTEALRTGSRGSPAAAAPAPAPQPAPQPAWGTLDAGEGPGPIGAYTPPPVPDGQQPPKWMRGIPGQIMPPANMGQPGGPTRGDSNAPCPPILDVDRNRLLQLKRPEMCFQH